MFAEFFTGQDWEIFLSQDEVFCLADFLRPKCNHVGSGFGYAPLAARTPFYVALIREIVGCPTRLTSAIKSLISTAAKVPELATVPHAVQL